jgi:outer membrane protein OmpA-like peptidoglycan-associated protein
MKNTLLTMLLIVCSIVTGYAQSTTAVPRGQKRGSEFILKGGLGHVKGGFFKPIAFRILSPAGGAGTLGFINSPTMKWGAMGGLDYNYYFGKSLGLSATADIFSNKYNLITASNPWFTPSKMILVSQKNQVNKYIGLGPIWRLPFNDKWHASLAAYGGVLFHKKNSYQADYATSSAPNATIMQFSSTKSVLAFAVKGSARIAYDPSPNFGVSLGAEYIIPFFGETAKNDALMHKSSTGYLVNVPNDQKYISQPIFDSFYNQTKPSLLQEQTPDPLRIVAINLGIHWRLGAIAKGGKKKGDCCSVCPEYAMGVTARDKYTREVLPNTDVAIKNAAGEIIKTGKTNSFGIVIFEKILKQNYTISGLLNGIELEGSSIKESELICDRIIQKEIVYADRNFIIKGKAFVCNTTTPLAGINVTLENNDLAFKRTTVTDAEGNFVLTLPEKGSYNLYGRKENYMSQVEVVNADNYNRDKNLFVKLEICAEKVDCDKAINLKNILFDLDKFAIKPAAKLELNKLVQFMKDNPGVKVEVGSHTDCRNTDNYNQTLSENRAKASVDYVVSQGIDRSRISGKGYGESVLLNKCADGVSCSEAEHSINRRTEMKVICPDKK